MRCLSALLLAFLLALHVPAVKAKIPRSAGAKREFQRENPCPATGKPRGKCPGYQIDHVIPLCAGGADAAWNLQWMTIEDHKIKTRGDVRYCRKI